MSFIDPRRNLSGLGAIGLPTSVTQSAGGSTEGGLLDWLTGGGYTAGQAPQPTAQGPSTLDKGLDFFTNLFKASSAAQTAQANSNYQMTVAAQQAQAAARTQQLLIFGGIGVVALFMIMRKD